VAAFPPPTLSLGIDSPLGQLFGDCVTAFTSAGTRFVEPDVSLIWEWLVSQPPTPFDTVFRQFEELLNKIARHRGPVDGISFVGRTWSTPHDALNYFKTWRTNVAVAVSQISTPVFFDPSWRTEAVTLLAKGIDTDRAFDRLPILADALEEAGCDHPLVLTHLREPYDHAHHCWVVDLLSFGGRPLATECAVISPR
jgi:hypothetical protein